MLLRFNTTLPTLIATHASSLLSPLYTFINCINKDKDTLPYIFIITQYQLPLKTREPLLYFGHPSSLRRKWLSLRNYNRPIRRDRLLITRSDKLSSHIFAHINPSFHFIISSCAMECKWNAKRQPITRYC